MKKARSREDLWGTGPISKNVALQLMSNIADKKEGAMELVYADVSKEGRPLSPIGTAVSVDHPEGRIL